MPVVAAVQLFLGELRMEAENFETRLREVEAFRSAIQKKLVTLSDQTDLNIRENLIREIDSTSSALSHLLRYDIWLPVRGCRDRRRH